MADLYDLYVITCLTNGKRYVGQSKYDYLKRWRSHQAAARSLKCKTIFAKAIRKYEDKNFIPSLLMRGLTSDEADDFESYFIKLWKTNDIKYGYNSTSGGKNGSLTRKSILKGRETSTGFSVAEIQQIHASIISLYNENFSQREIRAQMSFAAKMVRGTIAEHRKRVCFTCFDEQKLVAYMCPDITRPTSKMPKNIVRTKGKKQSKLRRLHATMSRQKSSVDELLILHEKVLSLKEQNVSFMKVAQELNIGKTTVCNIVRFHKEGTCPVCAPKERENHE